MHMHIVAEAASKRLWEREIDMHLRVARTCFRTHTAMTLDQDSGNPLSFLKFSGNCEADYSSTYYGVSEIGILTDASGECAGIGRDRAT